MRRLRCLCRLLLSALLSLSAIRAALPIEGAIGIHDPSTVMVCNGRYYVYGTGRGISCLTSSDGYTWERGPRVFERIPDSVHSFVPNNDGVGVWAPDVVKLNHGYGIYYAVSKWGTAEACAIGLVTSPTLDPKDPQYKWTDQGMIVHSVPKDDYSAIDPGVCRAPDGTLWMCSGSFHGKIQLVQLDGETGRRIAPDSPVSIIGSGAEASDILYHDGYFYLLFNRGSCCQGKTSTYNIRVGRSRKVTGPYLDRHGDDMTRGGGTLFLAAEGKQIGPGHFGLLAEDGVEKFSCHYEADMDRGGRPVLGIRPLLWTSDGWPMAGSDVSAGTYQIRSQQTGTVLQVPKAGSSGDAHAVTARYLTLENQKWAIAPVAGGFYKIVGAESGAALTEDGEAAGMAAFTGADAQLWKIDELSDGSYRIAAKHDRLALTALIAAKPGNGVGLKPFGEGDTQRWAIVAP